MLLKNFSITGFRFVKYGFIYKNRRRKRNFNLEFLTQKSDCEDYVHYYTWIIST